jgi:hypothetical protein
MNVYVSKYNCTILHKTEYTSCMCESEGFINSVLNLGSVVPASPLLACLPLVPTCLCVCVCVVRTLNAYDILHLLDSVV